MYIDYIRLEWEKVSKRSYLQRIPSIRKMDGLRFNAPVTFFVGENGSGKSTLLEAIAVAYGFNPEGGSYNYRFSTFDDHSNLHWEGAGRYAARILPAGGKLLHDGLENVGV